MIIAVVLTILVVLAWYKKDLLVLQGKMKEKFPSDADKTQLGWAGITDILANKLAFFSGSNIIILISIVIWMACFGSSILDNVVLVAAIIPVIQSFKSIGINVFLMNTHTSLTLLNVI